jgi:hypothetical protein
MTCLLGYHTSVPRRSVIRRIAPAVAVFGLLLLPVLLVSSSHAQINGVPASVTSPGFGGRAINGVPPSVTSLGPRGFAPNFNQAGVRFSSNVPMRDHGFDRDRGRHGGHDRDFLPAWGAYAYPVVVPYPVDAEPYAEEDDSNYQGGPTIFDRRGRGDESYVPPVRDSAPVRSEPSADSTAAVSAPQAPEQPQEPTLLAFKDGHVLEVGNYAIVGQTLFDLTPGHTRKIAIADLDLDATQKMNDERGVIFQLPPSAQAN